MIDDITRCNATQCSRRDRCLRATHLSRDWVSMAVFDGGDDCDGFIEEKSMYNIVACGKCRNNSDFRFAPGYRDIGFEYCVSILLRFDDGPFWAELGPEDGRVSVGDRWVYLKDLG